VRPSDRLGGERRDPTPPKRIGLLVARTSRILNAGSLEEVAAETADALRRVLRVERAAALVQAEGFARCAAQSPRWDVRDATEPTRAVPLVARDGRRLGAVQVWARAGAPLSVDDEQVVVQLAGCAAAVVEATLARSRAADGLVARIGRLLHDLRTPLAAILSWSWALKQGLDPARTARALAAIERNALAQSRLLEEAAAALRAAASSEPDTPSGPARRSLNGRSVSAKQGGQMRQRLRDVMTMGVATVAPGDTIRYAAERMEALDVGSLPVCDGERLIGVVTDRDIAVRAVAAGRDPNRTAVIETMTPALVFAYEEQALDEAVDLMREHEIRRLPVVDASHRLVGIVALADLAVRGDLPAAADALGGVSKPRGLQE
jgi:CBS domain-containing protein